MAAAGHINAALAALNLVGSPPDIIYAHVDQIVAHLENINAANPIPGVVTGNISERLCRYGLQTAVSGANAGTVSRMPRVWKWIGDFYVQGDPFNLIISVKSFAARERLLASGTGNLLSPTVAWGLFNEPDEFTYDRMLSYAYRAFIAIYAPSALLAALPQNVLGFTNVNGTPMLRALHDFPGQIQAAIQPNQKINPRMI